MSIKTIQDNSTVTLAIEGRVDTNTSPQLQDALINAFQNAQTVIVDFSSVAYISSAGLRALLVGQKTASSKGVTMELSNVSSTVYSILESVGFAQILTIK